MDDREIKKIISIERNEVSDLISSIPNIQEALKAAIRQSGLREKQIYCELEIDAAQWSRIMTGQAHFPHQKLLKFFEIVGNDIPLHWWAYQRGYELRVIPKTLEEQLKRERAEKEKLMEKNQILEELLLKKKDAN